ncbi:MAG TPA: glycyl-radical enzyme activating protein [Ruminiclostridium sp.]|nr:glycyl-radical enzyme activating protein [Ruminiclostridium sp.]
MKVKYFDIEWLSETDGPGNRTVLFLQGCNLRCPWCHSPHSREVESPILFNGVRCVNCHNCMEVCTQNVHSVRNGIHMVQRDNCIRCGRCIEACPASRPDTNSGALSLPTRSIEVSELFSLLHPQLEVLKNSGGLTLSGGEALLQKEAIMEILKLCKSHGIHTAVETSLTLPEDYYSSVSGYVDCWLIGLRGIYLNNISDHVKNITMDNVRYFSRLDTEAVVRFPAIKGFTVSEIQLSRLAEAMSVGAFNNIEILPCNKNMGHYYRLSGIAAEINIEEAFPDEKEVNDIASFFKARGFNVKVIS